MLLFEHKRQGYNAYIKTENLIQCIQKYLLSFSQIIKMTLSPRKALVLFSRMKILQME